jgi:hypothetical protein
MERHRNSMEFRTPILYGEVLWRFLWNFSVGHSLQAGYRISAGCVCLALSTLFVFLFTNFVQVRLIYRRGSGKTSAIHLTLHLLVYRYHGIPLTLVSHFFYAKTWVWITSTCDYRAHLYRSLTIR